MASLKFPHTFPMVGNTCTDKLCISYEQSDLYMLVTTKSLLVATTRAQVNVNRVQLYHLHCNIIVWRYMNSVSHEELILPMFCATRSHPSLSFTTITSYKLL